MGMAFSTSFRVSNLLQMPAKRLLSTHLAERPVALHLVNNAGGDGGVGISSFAKHSMQRRINVACFQVMEQRANRREVQLSRLRFRRSKGTAFPQ
jgi:hypothetical protein